MKYTHLFPLLLSLFILSGCGNTRSGGSFPTDAAPAEADGAPAVSGEGNPSSHPAIPKEGLPELPEGVVAEGTTVEYIRDLPAAVDNGRELTLRLHCRAVASSYGTWNYGVGRIDVQEGEELLQTLSVRDAVVAAEVQEWQQMAALGDPYYQEKLESGELPEAVDDDAWTACFEELYLPEIMDLNFDGADDIRLMEFLGTVNGRYLHWLWEPETQQFVYAFCLVGYDFQIDTAARQLVSESRNGYGIYDTDYYQYDADGVLQRVKNVALSPSDSEGAAEGDFVATVHEWVDGVWTETE